MNQDLTPVTVFTQLASMVFGISVAMVVGPYIVILIGAMGGSAVAIMQRESTGNFKAFVYFMAMTAFSVLITVPASMGVALVFGGVQAHWLFAPVSFALGYIAGSPRAALAWIGSKLNALVDILIQMRGQR